MDSWLESYKYNENGIPIGDGYVLNENVEINHTYPLDHFIGWGDLCIFIMEIKQTPGHFAVYNVSKGKMVPGILELYRFRLATEDDV